MHFVRTKFLLSKFIIIYYHSFIQSQYTQYTCDSFRIANQYQCEKNFYHLEYSAYRQAFGFFFFPPLLLTMYSQISK